MSLGIDGCAIGNSAESFDLRKLALVRNFASREIVVVGRDRPAYAVGAIEGAIVGAEARTVGTSDGGIEDAALERRIEAED